jgi:hypothetical protein
MHAIIGRKHWAAILHTYLRVRNCCFFADDPGQVVIATVAPSVRVTIAEAVGLPGGMPLANQAGPLVTALHELGFDYVFDTQLAADLTIMEEGSELLHRCVGVVRQAPLVHPFALFLRMLSATPTGLSQAHPICAGSQTLCWIRQIPSSTRCPCSLRVAQVRHHDTVRGGNIVSMVW